MIRIISLLLLFIHISPAVFQFNPDKFASALSTNEFTFIYFYSSTYPHLYVAATIVNSSLQPFLN